MLLLLLYCYIHDDFLLLRATFNVIVLIFLYDRTRMNKIELQNIYTHYMYSFLY